MARYWSPLKFKEEGKTVPCRFRVPSWGSNVVVRGSKPCSPGEDIAVEWLLISIDMALGF